jgi:AraC-like DNA-binding protein
MAHHFRRQILAAFLSLVCMQAIGQSMRDTSLLSFISRPFFYNVVKDREGNIYAGTSEGVFRMEETSPVKVNDRKGYLRIDQQGAIDIDTTGVRFHKQTGMTHLLPFPEEQQNEYHAGNEEYFYITSGGRMHVYEVRPYGYRFRNHSIRTISKHFTGTYSGIYYRDQKLKSPVSPFTDGYIRELNGKVFMCTHGLDIFSLRDIASGVPDLKVLPVGGGFNIIPCRDVRSIDRGRQYLVANGNRLVLMDSSLQKATIIFTGPGDAEVVLMNEDPRYYTTPFSQGNRLYIYDAVNRKVINGMQTEQPIMDGHFRDQQEFLLTADALLRTRERKTERLAKGIERAHTLKAINETDFAIATDMGLFLYNIQEDKLSALIPRVEFNRRALHIEDNKLFAGSINGLYILDLANLDKIVAFNERQFKTDRGPSIPRWVILLFTFLTGGLLLINQRYRRRIKRMETALEQAAPMEAAPRITREDIAAFIASNLATASLKTILDHFKTSNSTVYALLEPQKPGGLIQDLRQEKVKAMRSEGKGLKEIAEATGLSESYIRKIWKKA